MTAGPSGSGSHIPPRLVVLAGRKGRPSLLPFMCVLLAVLTLGLIGLLLLNTAVNKGAFELRNRQQEQTKLTQQEQLYQQQLSKLSEPGALASKAAGLGMVPGGNPAFLDPVAGGMLGTPAAPTPVPSAPPTTAPTAPATVPATPTSGPASGTPVAPQNPAGAPPAALPTTPTAPTTAVKATATSQPSLAATASATVPATVPKPNREPTPSPAATR